MALSPPSGPGAPDIQLLLGILKLATADTRNYRRSSELMGPLASPHTELANTRHIGHRRPSLEPWRSLPMDQTKPVVFSTQGSGGPLPVQWSWPREPILFATPNPFRPCFHTRGQIGPGIRLRSRCLPRAQVLLPGHPPSGARGLPAPPAPAGPRLAPRSPHLLLPLGADAAAVLPHHVLHAQFPQKLRGLRGTARSGHLHSPARFPLKIAGACSLQGLCRSDTPMTWTTLAFLSPFSQKNSFSMAQLQSPRLGEPSRFFSGHKIISPPHPTDHFHGP